MAKIKLKGAAMLSPLPAVMVTVADGGKPNIITVAWTGVICSDPPRVFISLRPERYSYRILKNSGEFVINLTTSALTPAADYCGFRSGRETDKFAEMKLTPAPAFEVAVPLIGESPINLECRVFDTIELGSHEMFLADVLCVDVDESVTDKGKVDYAKCNLINYQHGEYYGTGRHIGRFGFSVAKKFVKENGKGTDVDVTRLKGADRKSPKKSGKR